MTTQNQSVQQLQQQQGATSILFNNLNHPTMRMGEISSAIENFHADFGFSKSGISTNDLGILLEQARGIQDALKVLELTLQREILPRSMATAESWIASAAHAEAPTIGQDFVDRMRDVNCRTVIRPGLAFPAIYTSYSYALHNKGFANEIGLDPQKCEDVSSLSSSIVHEMPHAFQKHSATALRHSPFNPDTRVIVHPREWIMLENLCERDAYAKQALFNYLLSRMHPDDYQTSDYDAVTANEMGRYLQNTSSLQEALTEAAYWSLKKDKYSPSTGFTFEDHYHLVAINNYGAGMNQRMNAKESNFVFVRLTEDDYYQVGAYDVGPNSLGSSTIDERFLQPKALSQDAQEKLNRLCHQYNIPALDECITLQEYINQQKKATATPAVAYSSSSAVHAPVMA